jgi:hypothetical protein
LGWFDGWVGLIVVLVCHDHSGIAIGVFVLPVQEFLPRLLFVARSIPTHEGSW